MPKVDLIYFQRPNGHKINLTFDVDDTIAEKAQSIQDLGCRLTAETLRTNEVSFAIEDPTLGDFDIHLSSTPIRPPKAHPAFLNLIERFDESKFTTWRTICHNNGD